VQTDSQGRRNSHAGVDVRKPDPPQHVGGTFPWSCGNSPSRERTITLPISSSRSVIGASRTAPVLPCSSGGSGTCGPASVRYLARRSACHVIRESPCARPRAYWGWSSTPRRSNLQTDRAHAARTSLSAQATVRSCVSYCHHRICRLDLGRRAGVESLLSLPISLLSPS
jgi:hypothetical protein